MQTIKILLLLLVSLQATLLAEVKIDWEEAEKFNEEWQDVLFVSTYEIQKNTTFKQKQHRAYKGYCVNRLYFPHTVADPKEEKAGQEIWLFTEGALDTKVSPKKRTKVIYNACRKVLNTQTEEFRTELFRIIKLK